MEFKKHSGIYTLTVKQLVKAPVEAVWAFFSNAENLNRLTPSDLGFVITSSPVAEMYPGQIITYKIGIFPLIKSNWVTEITFIKENSYFIDEQRFGPYKMWHHEHHFRSTENGTEMTDKVSLALPFGLLGHLAWQLFVKHKLTGIFNFRSQTIQKIFTAW